MAANVAPEFLEAPTTLADLLMGQFLKPGDLKNHKVTFTIASVNAERVIANAKGDKKEVSTISFRHIQGKRITEKRWMLNAHNSRCLGFMFGEDLRTWVGKRVTLMSVPYSNPMIPDVTEALRVYGSPDIETDIPVSFRAGFKTTKTTLYKTVRETKPGTTEAPKSREPGQEG